MDILIINKRAPFDGLGAEKIIWEIGKRFAKEGHSITFFCPTPTDTTAPSVSNISFEFVETPDQKTRSQIEFFIRGPPKYPDVYETVNPDVVYDNPSPFLFHLAHYYGDAPVVNKVHTIYRRKAFIAKDNWLVKLGTVLGDESYRLLRNELFTPVSSSTASRLEVLLSSRTNSVITNPNGIEHSGFKSAADRTDKQVLYLSKLGRKKGILTLLSAWRAVERQHPEATLVVAGSGPLKERAERQATQYGLSSVRFEGYVSEQRKHELLSTSPVFVLPTHIEGMPLTIIEAMASGCAIVSTDTYGVHDVVEDGQSGILVEPGDGNELAAALHQLLANPERTGHLGEQARIRSRDFQQAEMLERELQIVEEWLPSDMRITQ